MAVLVALVKGTNNSDYHASRRLQALANAGVGNGLLVTTNQVALGWWFVEVTRLGGDPFYILVEVTTNTVIDTTGTKKIWIEINQSYIDETLAIPGDRSTVATIQTGASYPASGSYIKLASTSSGVITDERVFISLNTIVNLRKWRTPYKLFMSDASGNEIEFSFWSSGTVLGFNGASSMPTAISPTVDIVGLTEDTDPDEAADFLVSRDTSASSNKKVKPNNIKAQTFFDGTAGEALTAGQPLRYGVTYAWQSITFGTDNSDDTIGYDTGTWYAKGWSFTASVWWKLTQINMGLKKQGSPTMNLTMKLFTAAGVEVATSSTTIAASWLTAWIVSTAFAFDNILLSPGEVYQFYCIPSATNTTNHVRTWQANTDGYYGGGTGYRMDNGGVKTAQSLDRWTGGVTIAAAWETATKLYRTRWLTDWGVKCVWIARNTVSTDQTVEVNITHNNNQSGLTRGAIYYIGDSYGSISTTPGKSSKAIGVAITDTTIAMDYI